MNKVNSSRRQKERDRAYGPPERRAWVRSLPCCIKDCPNPSANVHVSPENEPSGMGRKGDYCYIVPMCNFHHIQLHTLGQRSFNDLHRTDVALVAVATHVKWLERDQDDEYDLAV
jgi:hypothetical protein